MTEQKKIRLTICISEQVDELIRDHIRRKGDISRIISELVIQKFMPEAIAREAEKAGIPLSGPAA